MNMGISHLQPTCLGRPHFLTKVALSPLLLAATLLVTGCGGGDSGDASSQSIDTQIINLASSQGATGDPTQGAQSLRPDQNSLVKLGELLFFSKTLGGTFDSACASCHQPQFAGGDQLSLPVGVGAQDPDFVGPGRTIDVSRDYDPNRDGGPNVPRNSQTIINSSLYKKSLFFDGRVSTRNLSGNVADGIVTPDSPLGGDPNAGGNLLSAQARFPSTAPDEMRNFLHPELTTSEEFRNLLVMRLKGQADTANLSQNAPQNWLALFRQAFGQPAATADSLITYTNVETAIAVYESSLVFANTPWRRYVAGDPSALSEPAKQGALLFFRSKNAGGLGCSGCHSGSFFTNEGFYNAGFPQFGRGKRADKRDYGRWQVTKQDADKFTFRVPSLLNVALTPPYGHAGQFQDLESLLRYHANPAEQSRLYDYSLQSLDQFKGETVTYPLSPGYTQEAIESPNLANDLLPERNLTDTEITDLKAFLLSLTDDCLAASTTNCLAPWVPAASEDPDGNQLKNFSATNPNPSGPPPSGGSGGAPSPYPAAVVDMDTLGLAPRQNFPDTQPACAGAPAAGHRPNDGNYFSEESQSLGLTIPHGYDQNAAWFYKGGITNFEQTSFSGGVTAAYLNDDCWPDIAYASGSVNGMIGYLNQPGGGGFVNGNIMPGPAAIGGLYTGVGVADLQGDYHRELVLGNLAPGYVRILKEDDAGQYREIASYQDPASQQKMNGIPMARDSFGIAFGDYNGDGYPDMYLGHWDFGGLPGTAPAFWINKGGNSLSPFDNIVQVGTANGISQNWQFTPGFVDVDGDGWQDLLIASDFLTTTVLQNVANENSSTQSQTARVFKNITDLSVVTDENGMGATQGDFTNSGKLDWFVTDVYYPPQTPLPYVGIHGNHLYRNLSTPGTIKFQDVSATSGISNAMWAWGTCTADFNNDGWLDIFVVNGFGAWTNFVNLSSSLQEFLSGLGLSPIFQGTAPRLFLNNGDGTFTERSVSWKVNMPLNGRGLACFDFDRDGDIDVAALNQSVGIKLFENHSGSGPGHHFANIRLVGNPPNTDALGASVYVTADINGDGIIESNETQLRVSMANSNFNSQNLPDLHFGLGKASSIAQMVIRWPDGIMQTFQNIAANQFLIYHHP